jgi:hypothetical protein
MHFMAMTGRHLRRAPSSLRPVVRATVVLGIGLLIGAPVADGAKAKKPAVRSADDLLIVDCLLPSKVRRLGRQQTYLQPRKPIRTTAVDCQIRGGEYTQPDQANYATALEVWLPQAKAGDAEAQYYVGQIFEKGLGSRPDYTSAASWYRRAAEQDYESAQISLGYLYEQGLGVEADDVEALNWYRRAAGLAEELVVLQESDYADLVAAQAELASRAGEVEALQEEIEELRRQLAELSVESEADERRRTTLESLVGRLQNDLDEQKREVSMRVESISALEQRLQARQAEQDPNASGQRPTPVIPELDFGSYHALVIGNENYQTLPSLETAAEDADAVASLLESKYGFDVELLIDADRYQTMTALNRLRESLTEEDNLLVYYAGHGRRDEQGATAYWQPVDAEADNPANWIPSEVITEHLDLVSARHVLVVADSAYSGLRSRSSIAQLPRGMSEEQRFHHLRLMRERRARLVLSSGESAPVAATAGAGRSRFSTAFLSVLEQNDGVLEASRVYQRLVEQVGTEPGARPPEFATMRWARNNIADFFFVPGS